MTVRNPYLKATVEKVTDATALLKFISDQRLTAGQTIEATIHGFRITKGGRFISFPPECVIVAGNREGEIYTSSHSPTRVHLNGLKVPVAGEVGTLRVLITVCDGFVLIGPL